MQEDPNECATYLKALADPFRLQIIRALQSGPLSVSDVAELLESNLANASHHLRVLFHAGIVITERDGNEMAEEGCLSLPSVYAEVPRSTRIRVRALNEHGKQRTFEAEGFLARIIQHEVDHLDGILFIDRLDIMTREAKLREWQDAREDLGSMPIDQS